MRVKRLWRRDTEGHAGLFVEVVCGHIAFHEKRGRDPAIVGLRADGKPAWERVFDRDAVRYFFSWGSSLYLEGEVARRLDAETGETMAERDLGTRVSPRPGPRWVSYRGAEPAFLVGLTLDALEELWRRPAPGGWDDHDDFLCRYAKDGTIQFVDLTTSRESAPVQGPARSEYGRAHTHVGDLWCQFYDKERVGIDTRTGSVAWRIEESGFGYHHTARFVGDVAYSGDRGLSAYDLKSGEMLWRQDFSEGTSWLSSSPDVADGRIYVGSKDLAFHAVDAATGRVLLSHEVDFEPTVVKPMAGNRIVVGGFEEIACFQVSP